MVRKLQEKESEAEKPASQREKSKAAAREAMDQIRKEGDIAIRMMKDSSHLEDDEKHEIACKVVSLEKKKAVLIKEFETEEVIQVGTWRVVGGRRTRCVDIVTKGSGIIGKQVVDDINGSILKVRVLLRAQSLDWDVSAVIWKNHGTDEVLWTVSIVGGKVDSQTVRHLIFKNVRAV